MEQRLTVMDSYGNPVGEAVLRVAKTWQSAMTITLPDIVRCAAQAGIRAGILRVDWPIYDRSAFANILPQGHAIIAENDHSEWVECLIEGPDMPLRRADGSYEMVQVLVALDTRLPGHDRPELALYWAHMPDKKWRVSLDTPVARSA